MLKKIFKFLLNAYIVMVLFPYMIIVFFYAVLKYFAEEGSRLDSQVGDLENDLVTILVDMAKGLDIGFLVINIVALIWWMIVVAFLKKYKFVIPRKKNVNER